MGRGDKTLRPFFMNIILPKVATYSDGQIAKALERELRMGLELKKQWENRREIKAAAEAKAMKGSRDVPGLGKFVATMPEWEFFRLREKYGNEEVHSDEFIRDFQKRNPHLSGVKL